MDPLNSLLRLVIITAFKDIDLRLKFKGMDPDEMGETERYKAFRAVWSCGDSANRLCYLLTGDPMREVSTDGFDVTDDDAVGTALKAMAQETGPVLVRIQVLSRTAGHAYVFVSRYQGGGGTLAQLEGYIYQTNIGVRSYEFDLHEWVADAKSTDLVFLPGYLLELRAKLVAQVPDEDPQPDLEERREAARLTVEAAATLIGTTPGQLRDWEAGRSDPPGHLSPAIDRAYGPGRMSTRSRVYEQNFMPTKVKLSPESQADITREAAEVKLMWRPIDQPKALSRLGQILRDELV